MVPNRATHQILTIKKENHFAIESSLPESRRPKYKELLMILAGKGLVANEKVSSKTTKTSSQFKLHQNKWIENK